MAYKQLNMNVRRVFFMSSRHASSNSNVLKGIGPGGFVLLTIPVATFCLGTWQVRRRTWKLNLMEKVKKKNEIPPVELPDDFRKLSEMEYQRVHVRGIFDHSKELFIGPRPRITKTSEEGGGLMSSRPQCGTHVITPFHVTDKNVTILVNRGWVPKDKADPSARSEGQVKDEIDLIGTVRLSEKGPQCSIKDKPGSNQFFIRNVQKLAEITGAAPVFLDADEASTVPGGPVGGQTRIAFRNQHLSYILTWYSLSAATSYMWYKKYIRGRIAL